MIKNNFLNKKMIIYFLIITLLLTTKTYAQTPITTTTDPLINTMIQENIKTRLEIKQYCDQKITSMVELVKTEGANIIGQNFQEFDRRIHDTAQKLFIKLIIATFTTILLACLVYYIIRRKIEKKHMPKAMHFKEVAISPTQVGIITEPYKPKPEPPIPKITPQAPTPNTTPTPTPAGVTTAQKTQELPAFPQTEYQPPTPATYQQPQIPVLQQPIILSPKEKDKILREQEEIEKRKRKEAQKKLEKLIDEHNKNRKRHLKLRKKLSKPEEQKDLLEQEHEIIQKQIDELSQQYNLPTTTGKIENM